MRAAAGRLGEPADDEFLSFRALDLEPIQAAAWPVEGVAALGDESLEMQVAGLVDDFLSRALNRIAKAYRVV